LALYRAGRRAESLEAYRSGRRLLTESLGMEPGPELQRLHQAVLRDDPALAPLAGAPAPWAPPPAGAPWVPAQLPPPVAAFTGRAAEFAALDELADAAGAAGEGEGRPLAVGVITGVAGVGKTGLAVQWSHRAARRFPGGQLFADLR